jgi:hypothetical protein
LSGVDPRTPEGAPSIMWVATRLPVVHVGPLVARDRAYAPAITRS